MATAGTRSQKPVGSAAWISSEKENIHHLVDQEMEEIAYPVSHEMAWLNEHMAEVFSKNQFNFTEVFKTPGKLRGKTPRTARKKNVDEQRVPLSEIFSSARKQTESKSNASPSIHRSPAKSTAPQKTTTVTSSAKEPVEHTSHPQYPNLSQNLNSFPQYNTDSGYHGMPGDDDMVLPNPQPELQPDSQASTQPFTQEDHAERNGLRSPADRVTDDSFHSALENIRQRGTTVEPMDVDDTPKNKVEVQIPTKELKEKEPEEGPDAEHKPASEPMGSSPAQKRVHIAVPEPEHEEKEQEREQEAPSRSSPLKAPVAQPQHQEAKADTNENPPLDNMDDIESPLDESSPEKPPIRKSSLNFASLPAREPLTKRTSRTSHLDSIKQSTGGSGYFGRQTGGHRATQVAFDENTERDDKMDIDEKQAPREDLGSDNRASKLHSKSSTQRLHEKISMLGKMQPSRPSKSIPSAPGLASNQVAYPELPASKPDEKTDTSHQKTRDTPGPDPMEVDNEDWIKPLDSAQNPTLQKSQTVDVMGQPDQVDDEPSHTRNQDQSIDQPAKNGASIGGSARPQSAASMFSPRQAGHQKSASVSNFAPGESTTPVGSPGRQDGPLSASKSRLQSIMRSAKGLFSSSGGAAAATKTGSLSPETPRTAARNRANTHTAGISQVPRPAQVPSPVKQEGRRTRSSTEREERRKQQELEDRQREEEQLKAQEQEKQKTAQLKAAKDKASVEPETNAAPSSPKRLPRPQQQTSKEPESNNDSKHAAPSQSKQGRPVKPTRAPVQQPKPQPVSIRVGSALSRQMPLASSSLSSSVQESNPPAPASTSKQPTIKKKASNSSLHTAPSTSSFKSSVSSQSQRKAQLANEKKKEQEEREARRKEEQKRELERKRAAQQQQQQQEEARRQEARSRAEAERKERERERAAIEESKKAAHMQAIEKRRLENARRLERQGSQQPNEADKQGPQPTREGPSRPTSRLNSIQQYGRPINQPQPNPAKPPKRVLDDEATHRPAPRKPSATMQPTADGKRRRTEDAENPMPVRPTMAPPIRQSNIRKEPTKPSVFGGQSSTAGPSGSSIFKGSQPQRPAHPMDMAKYTTGKIPFAEPHAPSKTPTGNPSKAPAPAPARPSPKYPNGDNIALPEIATDSEDEDSDSEMLPVPKWAQPKELESLLRQQEGMEVDSIFGPIAPFSLEETFKADKKIKKFRERTSSANWGGADGLTQDEIRKDLSERQRMKLNGGWSWNG